MLRLVRQPLGAFQRGAAGRVTRRAASAAAGGAMCGRVGAPLGDVPVAGDPATIETRPSLAASPRRQDALVLAYVAAGFPTSPGTRCFVARSLDRGRTWTRRTQLPLRDPLDNCSDPIVAYAPDGRLLFAAYREIRVTEGFAPGTTAVWQRVFSTNVVVSRSADDGRTWSAPVTALAATPYALLYPCADGACAADPTAATPGAAYDRPSLAVSGAGSRGRDPRPAAMVVHVASTRIAQYDVDAPPTVVAVARSTDDGASWSAPRDLDAGQVSGPQVVVQGPRLAAGAGGEALVAWYHSGDDGYLAGDFQVRVARSRDTGASWDPVTVAAVDGSEAGQALGPAGFKGRQWWTTMLPDQAIDGTGRAHIVYTRDPAPGSGTSEEGDIRHVQSPGPPYTAWSEPVTVNDDGDGRAQGFASLVARRDGRTTAVEAVWEDTRLAPAGSFADQVRLYDVFHARLVPGSGWSANARVSDASSTQSRRTAPGGTALTANLTGVLFAAWADRRGFVSLEDPASNVFGSRVALR
jgi:hypothetical protein